MPNYTVEIQLVRGYTVEIYVDDPSKIDSVAETVLYEKFVNDTAIVEYDFTKVVEATELLDKDK